MIERQRRETDMLGEVERDACEAVSQHISNERSDMMWWRRSRELSGDGCIKHGPPVFPLNQFRFPFTSHVT